MQEKQLRWSLRESKFLFEQNRRIVAELDKVESEPDEEKKELKSQECYRKS